MNTPTPETEELYKLAIYDLPYNTSYKANYQVWQTVKLLKNHMARLERERDGWREAAYSLGEAIPASWETLQPPAEQLRKFKEMVALENEKTKKLLDKAIQALNQTNE